MKRLCIFAHWDKDNIVDDYVLYYLKELHTVADKIIFVSDCVLGESELLKLKSLTSAVIAEQHGEYDFGSYKRGFLYAKEHNFDFDELIFANDSVYGPFYPLKPIFEQMEKKKCDFWGMTQDNYGLSIYIKAPHIQSYFLVFYKNVFNSTIFLDFINNIHKESSKDDIINKYEIGLSKILYQNNFKSCAYITKYSHVPNCTILKWDKLILKDSFPFLKTVIIKSGFDSTGSIKDWKKFIERKSNYPVEYIIKNSSRLSNMYENKYEKLNIYRKIRYNILMELPIEFRYVVIFLEKSIFNLLNTLCFHKLKKF